MSAKEIERRLAAITGTPPGMHGNQWPNAIRALLKAMREPSEIYGHSMVEIRQNLVLWQAMIDHLLAE